MKASVREGESNRDHMQEMMARIGNPIDTVIDGWDVISNAPRDRPIMVRDGIWSPFPAHWDGSRNIWAIHGEVSFVPTLWQEISQ